MKKEEIKALLAAMTLEEKIGQLTQLSGEFFQTENQEITGPIYAENQVSEAQVYQLGSVLGVYGVKNIRKIQKDYLEMSRLKIPLLFMADVIHGARMIFPIALGLATSWNPELARKTAEVAALEATAAGLHVTFSPMVDLVRDPRWGRVMESTGEDSYLNARFAEAFVKGFQGSIRNGRLDFSNLAACVKHFAAYGAVEAGREYNIVDIPENKLREFYLPAYKAAIDAGVKLIMTSFNTINGIPATGNHWLLKEILRDEWNFNGVVITDYGAIKEQQIWGYAADELDAAKKALSATVDIEMMTTAYLHTLGKLVKSDNEFQKLIDEAVLRILELKNSLGLFEDPFRGATKEREKLEVLSAENKQVAYEAATESIVLLQNEEKILPLKKSDKVAFIGPLLNTNDLLGAWSWKGKRRETQRISDFLPKNNVHPEKADKVVIFVGEKSSMSGESKSYSSISLPENQIKLIHRTLKINRNVILVVLAGRPLDLSSISDKVKAIFYSYFPGTMGAKAIINLLYGIENPSAKLTMSLPRAVGQVPIYYNNYNTGRPTETGDEEYVSRYQDVANSPLYAFGHGMSYSDFTYSDFSVKFDGEHIQCLVTLSNNGKFDGAEIVQVYVRALVGSTVRPLKELKAFEKVWLRAGESRQVQLEIDKSQLEFYNFEAKRVFEAGDFQISIAAASDDVKFDRVLNIK